MGGYSPSMPFGLSRFVFLLLAASCGGAPLKALSPSQQGTASVHAAAAGATAFVDDTKCDGSSDALHPFVMQWDPSTAAEFQGHAAAALAVVKLRGCRIELVETCRVPGQYRITPTAGNLATLRIDDEAQLYAKLPLAVASLEGHLKQSGSLVVKYFVGGMAYATAPVLYRSQLAQLGASCQDATHLVLNYAAGAYEVSSAASTGAGVDAKGFGAGAGASTGASTNAFLSGGQFDACPQHARECAVPVRLHLVPILDGDLPASQQQAAATAVSPPATAPSPALPPRDVQSFLPAVALASPAFKTCYNRQLERRLSDAHMQLALAVGADGVVSDVAVTLLDGHVDAEFLDCVTNVGRSLRFPPGPRKDDVKLPIHFKRPE